MEARVPEGTYAVYCASGSEWYGEFGYFGEDTRYSLVAKSLEVAPGGAMLTIPGADAEVDLMDFPY